MGIEPNTIVQIKTGFLKNCKAIVDFIEKTKDGKNWVYLKVPLKYPENALKMIEKIDNSEVDIIKPN